MEIAGCIIQNRNIIESNQLPFTQATRAKVYMFRPNMGSGRQDMILPVFISS